MPKKYRMTVADMKAFRPERRLSGTYFSLGVAKAERQQAACVVSKKVSLHAVDRNKIKRRARAVVGLLLPSLKQEAFVFYAKKEACNAAYAEIRRDIEKLLARIA